MAFPKFHGITLANNSWIENLHFERLAVDPMPISAGRVWFNIVEKAIKFSSLDAGGAVIVRSITSSEDLQIALTALQTELTAEGVARTTADAAEMAARIAAVTLLQQAITDEAAARAVAVAAEAASRVAGDTAEAAARVAADAVAAATAADQLATETIARLAGDAALGVRVDGVQSELDRTQAGVGLNVDGNYSAPENTVHLGSTSTVVGATVALDAAIVAESATRLGQVAGLSSALANEAQLRQDGDANLQAQLTAYVDMAVTNNTNADNAETVARIADVARLQAELDRTQATVGTDSNGNLIPISGTNYLNEVTTVFGGAFVLDHQIKVVADAVAAEGIARSTADTGFNTSLNTEIANRTASDDAQQQEINRVEAGAGLESDGTYAAPTGSNYLNSATSLKDADFVLDAAIKVASNQIATLNDVTVVALQAATAAETVRALAAEAAETLARSSADVAATSALAAESARAVAAESTLTTTVAAEVAARTSAISGVVSALGTEAQRAINAEAGINAQLAALSAAAGDGANALKAELNSGRFNYTANTPSLNHVIHHNLNTAFYLTTIMVQGADNVYRNDIVPVEEIDSNSFSISLTEARRVKVSVMGMGVVGAPVA